MTNEEFNYYKSINLRKMEEIENKKKEVEYRLENDKSYFKYIYERTISERNKKILVDLYQNKKTLRETGKELKISSEMVRLIKNKMINEIINHF